MEKHIAIVLGIFFVCIFGAIALENHQKNECRVEAIKAGKSAEDIAKICR